jgi:hypothetical protein
VANHVRDTTAVGVDQAAKQTTGITVGDQLLPGLEDDAALVLEAGTVLGEETRPVLRERVDLVYLLVAMADDADLVYGHR